MLRRAVIGLLLSFLPTLVWAQGALLQGGTPVPGQAPMYSGPQGGSQAVVQASGPAGGGGNGVGLTELLQVNRVAGTGPYGSHVALYDNPTNHAGGYHYFSMDANASGGGLLAYGYGGGASPLPFQFCVNGTCYEFPFVIGGIVGPGTTVIGDVAYWNNTGGTLLADSSALHLPLGPIVLPGSGSFFISDTPAAVIDKISDRLFVGQTAAAYTGSTTDPTWLAFWNSLTDLALAQFGVISTKGTAAVLGASRSSDWGSLNINRAIGGTFFGINDRSDASDAWGIYVEGNKASGQLGFTAAAEFDIGNYGATVDITPYTSGAPAGTNIGVWIVSGQGASAHPSSAAIGIDHLTQPFRKGLVFNTGALDSALGGGNDGVAIELAAGQSIRWLRSDGATLSEIWSPSGGGLDISGGFVTAGTATVGALTATTATFSGAVSAPAAAFSGAVSTGPLTVAGALGATGNINGNNISAAGTLGVGGVASFANNVGIAGALTVGSIANIGGNVGMSNDLTVSGTLGVAGAVTLTNSVVTASSLPTSSGGKCVGITPGGDLYISGTTC